MPGALLSALREEEQRQQPSPSTVCALHAPPVLPAHHMAPFIPRLQEQFPALGASTYVPPPNVAERNAALIAGIKKAVASDEGFAQFKDVSMRFRRGDISATEYYNAFHRICGAEAPRIFPELVALLPDTAKQQQLLQAHNDSRAQQAGAGPQQQLRILVVKATPGQGPANQPWQSSRAAQPAATFKCVILTPVGM